MNQQPNNARLNVFFGHHKAATSWIIKILSDIAYLNGYGLAIANTSDEFERSIRRELSSRKYQFLSLRNADVRDLAGLDEFRGFHVIRDPRDILVSSYFSHRKTHPTQNWPELAEHQERLAQLSLEEGLLADMEFCRTLPTDGFDVNPFENMRRWDYARPDTLELKYEELIINPYDSFIDVFRFLGILDESEFGVKTALRHLVQVASRRAIRARNIRDGVRVTTWNLLATVFDNSFSRKASGRKPGEEDPNSHYRKGVARDWENYFQPAHKAFFKANFGGLLTTLRYEEDDQW